MEEDLGYVTPAPAGIERVRRFVNSANHLHGRDYLTDGLALRALAIELRLPDPGDVDDDGLSHAIAVREALRDALWYHNGGPAVAGGLDGAARRARLAVRFRGADVVVAPEAVGVDAMIGALLAEVATAPADTWRRLKACRNPACRWAFYDHTRPGNGAWCTMRVCGRREKARRHRERERERR